MRRSALGPGGEFDVIRRILGAQVDASTRPEILVGPGDDCAVVRAGPLALTIDLAVEDVHFRRSWLGGREIGYRCATAALSDLAAMAAKPIGVLVSIAVPAGAATLAEEIAAGVAEAAAACDAVVLGGDLSGSPGPIVVDVAAAGEAVDPVTRAGARAGDELWVTGRLGGAAVAVAAWNAGQPLPDGARAAFVRPVARTAEARWLAESGALHAAIDLSDGLAADAAHLAAASGVAIVLDLPLVPAHAAVRTFAQDADRAAALVLGGGDDYELCIAAAPDALPPLVARFEQRFGVPLTRIGRVAAGAGVSGIGADGVRAPLAPRGYSHFGRNDA
jgi:thiamine-monophosphate kinase